MKISKKALSVFMAVLMVMTSLSVGLTALAATDSDWQALADALKNPDLPASSSYGQSGYLKTVNDTTGAVEAAAEAFWKVAVEIAPKHQGNPGKDVGSSPRNTARAVADEVLNTLQNKGLLTAEELAAATATVQKFVGDMSGNNYAHGSVSWGNSGPDNPGTRDYGIRITRPVAEYLMHTYPAGTDVAKLPDSIDTVIEYKWNHKGEEEKKVTLGFGDKWVWNYLNSWSKAVVGTDTTVVSQLKAFREYFSAEKLASDLSAMSGEELATLAANNQTQYDTAVNALGYTLLDHFFDMDSIKTFINDVEAARDLQFAREDVQSLQELMANDPATMEHDALLTLMSDLVGVRTSLQGLNADAVNAALAEAGLTWDAVNAYIASVNEEIEVDNLEGYKAVIDEIVLSLPEDLTTVEDGTALQADYAQLQTQMASVNDCTQGAIDRVFTEGTGYVLDAIHKLNVELQRRELLDESLEFGAYFAAHKAADLTTIDTDTLLTWRADDRAKFEEVKAYEPEALDAVYGEGWFASIEAYIASIDTTLNARIEAQIDEAVNNYQEFGQITILNYKEFKAAFDGIETQILGAITLSEDYQAKYDSLTPMLDQYTEFVNSKGLSSWHEGPVEYPTREIMAGDMARTAEETYEVTPEKLNTVITSIDSLMQNQELTELLAGLGVSGLEGTIEELILNALQTGLYTDATVNSVVTMIYPAVVNALAGKTLVEIIGIELTGDLILERLVDLNVMVYPNTLSRVIDGSRYPDVVAALNAAGEDWTKFDSTTVSWGVTDKETFISALSQALGGLTPILRSLLTNQALHEQTDIIGIELHIKMDAANLYNNAILPLLELLDCENVVPTDTYNTYTTSEQLLGSILTPILDWVDTLAAKPISSVLDILPKLAYIMEFDMISEALKATKINPILEVGDTLPLLGYKKYWSDSLLSLAGISGDNLYNLLVNLLPMLGVEGLDLSMLSDVNKLLSTVLGMVAPDANLVLPTIDQAYLASLGTLNANVPSGRLGGTRTEYVSDKPAVLLAVLRYVLPMLGDQDFMDALFALIGQMTGSEINLGEDVMDILKGLGSNPDGVICALTELFVPQEYASKEYTFKNVPVLEDENGDPILDENGNPVTPSPINTVTYSEDWTKDQAQYIADNLDEFVNNMMTILGGADMPTLGGLIRSYIADEFYTNETINSLILMIKDALGGIGMDLTPILGLVNIDLSAWDAVTESYDWGVIPGDSATFGDGLAKALAPFAPIMATLMSGEKDLTILGAVTMKSYPGYANGIVPLLENLGCNPESILSAEEYAALAASGNYDQMISAIIDPILNLVDRVYENPIDTLMDILPNLLYFIDCNNLQAAMENTLQSAFVMLDTVRPIYNISFDLNLNLQQILVDLIANLEIGGQKVNLKIPFLTNLSTLMVGTVTEYDSKSSVDPAYMLMNTDKADFVTVLMRNVVDLIFYADNQKVIADLIANQAGLDQETADALLKILNTFSEMYKEDNGVDKILHAGYVIFQTTHETGGDAITEIKDFNERWSEVFETLYNSGNQDLIDLAKWADSVLDFLSFGFITGDGVGTNGLIDFFERLIAFFQGKVTDVSIDRTSANMLQGEQLTLNLSFKPVTVKNKNAAWASSNERVATVVNGVVTAVGPGDAEITATTEDGGFTVSCVVRVRADKTALNEAIALVKGTELTAEQQAQISEVLAEAEMIAASELANQTSVDAACEALTAAFRALDLGTAVTSVAITQNGAAVGEVVYQKVSWTKRWNSTPVTLGVAINDGATVKSITWQYANWSVDDPEADIEPAADGMTAVIRAKNSVVGAHSCWIQVTVEDIYGNTVTSDPVKVRFYNYDWQK